MDTKEKIAFFGLGNMGLGMTENLIEAGHELHVVANQNREPIEQVIFKGATEWSTVAEATSASDFVFLCLPDSIVVERVMEELWDSLEKRHVVVDTGTSSLASTSRLHNKLQSIGVAFAEAPLSGGMQQAKAGQLGALVGADIEVLEKISPLLDEFCSTIEHIGQVGAGGRAKLLNNYMVIGFAAVVIEAFYSAKQLGVDWEKLYGAASCGSANSGVLQRIAGGAVEGEFTGYAFDVKAAYKDLRYIQEMSEMTGLEALLGNDALNLLQNAVEAGFGEHRISELMRDGMREDLVGRILNKT